MIRRHFLVEAAGPALTLPAFAQTCPGKSYRLAVAFASTGTIDVVIGFL